MNLRLQLTKKEITLTQNMDLLSAQHSTHLIPRDLLIIQLTMSRILQDLDSTLLRMQLNQMEIIIVPNISLQCVELSITMTGILYRCLKTQEVSKSNQLIIVSPGPGTYRIPSDFGYYENKNKCNTKLMSQTMTNGLLAPSYSNA
jgi:hypothetical protein